MNEKTLAFYVEFRGEPAAGLHPYTDVIRVVVESGVPGGESGEFADHIRQALAEWFDGASVEPLAEAEARWKREESPA